MLVTDIVMTMNSPCAVVVMYGLPVGSDTDFARSMLSTRNSNLPSRTADPAGATVGPTGSGTTGTGATVETDDDGADALVVVGDFFSSSPPLARPMRRNRANTAPIEPRMIPFFDFFDCGCARCSVQLVPSKYR